MHIHLQCMECNHRLEFRQRSGFHFIFNHIIQFSFRLRQEGTWPFYQIVSSKTECMPSSHKCLDYVLSCSILLGLSGRPVCSFLALYPDADVHGSSLMAQEDGDGHWHVSIDLSGSIAITKDHNQVAKSEARHLGTSEEWLGGVCDLAYSRYFLPLYNFHLTE